VKHARALTAGTSCGAAGPSPRAMPPPLGSPAPLPPPTNHAQGDENKEECRGLGDLLGAATDDRSDEGVDVEAVDDLVVVRVKD
jgi:hypothetical protein